MWIVRLALRSEALVVRGTKYFVPVVDDSSRVRYKKIKIAENTGEKIVLISGLKEGEQVALNLGESVEEGQKVKVLK